MKDSPKSSIGPWIFGCVAAVCIVTLVITGHQEFATKALEAAALLAFIIFMLACA